MTSTPRIAAVSAPGAVPRLPRILSEKELQVIRWLAKNIKSGNVSRQALTDPTRMRAELTRMTENKIL